MSGYLYFSHFVGRQINRQHKFRQVYFNYIRREIQCKIVARNKRYLYLKFSVCVKNIDIRSRKNTLLCISIFCCAIVNCKPSIFSNKVVYKRGVSGALLLYTKIKVIRDRIYLIVRTVFSLRSISGNAQKMHPANATHRQMNEEELIAAGVPGDLIRLSCGLENYEDLIEDIQPALDTI